MTVATASARRRPSHDEQVSGGGGGALANRGGQGREFESIGCKASSTLAGMHFIYSEIGSGTVANGARFSEKRRVAKRM